MAKRRQAATPPTRAQKTSSKSKVLLAVALALPLTLPALVYSGKLDDYFPIHLPSSLQNYVQFDDTTMQTNPEVVSPIQGHALPDLKEEAHVQDAYTQEEQKTITEEDSKEEEKVVKNGEEDLLEKCTKHTYSTEILSTSPLVIYINNFTSSEEADALIKLGEKSFKDSYISSPRGNIPVTGRTSTSAGLPLTDALVSCILSRARNFMGPLLPPDSPFSTPQLVRYFASQKFDLHTDHWPTHQVIRDGKEKGRLFNRPASFFVFLRADGVKGGETWFPKVTPASPLLASPEQSSIPKYVEAGNEGGKDSNGNEIFGGVKFPPIKGNAVFWVNVDQEGEGDDRVIHAGLPLLEGEKIGLNIWPRKWYGWEIGSEPGKKKERKKATFV